MKKVLRFFGALFATVYALVGAAIVFVVGILGFLTLREFFIEVDRMDIYWIFLGIALLWGLISLLCYFYRED